MNPLVLWHGWGMHPAVWDTLAAQLPLAPTVVALPGYAGRPDCQPHALDALVDALMAGVDEPITLCGWSLGAMLALRAAQRHPVKVARLVLIAATPRFVQGPDWPHGMTPEALAQFTQGVASDPATALKRFIALFNQHDVNQRALGRELARALAVDPLPSVSALVAGLNVLRDTDVRADLAHIHQPTLLLHGAHDPLMPLAAAQWLAAALPQATLAVLPEAAHAPFLSDAATCARLITEWLHVGH